MAGKHHQRLAGHIHLRFSQVGLIHPLNVAEQLFLRQKLVQPRLHDGAGDLLLGQTLVEQQVGLLQQFLIGEEQMPGLLRLVQQVAQPAADPQRVGGAAPDRAGDGVHDLEAKALNLAEAKGLVLKDLHSVTAKGFQHLCRLLDADPVGGKAGHNVP